MKNYYAFFQELIQSNKKQLTVDQNKLSREIITSKDVYSKMDWIECINEIKFENAAPLLYILLEDKNDLVRIEAVEALQNFPDKASINALQDVLRLDKVSLVRGYAYLTLSEIALQNSEEYPFIRQLLLSKLQTEHGLYGNLYLLEALYFIGEQNLLDNILRYLDCENYRIRCSVLHFLLDADIIDDVLNEKVCQKLKAIIKDEDSLAVKDLIEKYFLK